MKKLVSVMFAMFIAVSSAFAGPFGLEMGMNLDDITKVCGGNRPIHFEDDRYIISPIKSHPDFDRYMVCVADGNGLYRIRAISKNIFTTKYGTEVKSAFNDLVERLEKTYGKPQIIDEIKNDVYSFEKKDEYWLSTLRDGSRILAAEWSISVSKTKLPKDLVFVVLYATTPAKYSIDKGILILEYEFSNCEEVLKSHDDVF